MLNIKEFFVLFLFFFVFVGGGGGWEVGVGKAFQVNFFVRYIHQLNLVRFTQKGNDAKLEFKEGVLSCF